MAKIDERYKRMIERLEVYAAKDPRGYRMRVGLLAVLGYLYILSILSAVIAVIVALGRVVERHPYGDATRLEIALIVFAYLILRSTWVRIKPPTGTQVTAETAPALFEAINRLSRRIGSPRPDVVLIDDRFNATAAQVPRLGVFGMYRTYLTLGLPVMCALDAKQLVSVIAHEMGHLSANHGRFGLWIYRVHQTWFQLLDMLTKARHLGAYLFIGFFRWYAFFFAAYSFVLSRADEYAADRCAARATLPETAADALIAIAVRSRQEDDQAWDSVYEQIRTTALPPPGAYRQILDTLREELPHPAAEGWLRAAFTEKTEYADSHPSLSERVAALEGMPGARAAARDLPPTPETSAAEQLLGPILPSVIDEIDRKWRAQAQRQWEAQHRRVQKLRAELAKLNAEAERGTLTSEEQGERLRLVGRVHGLTAAVTLAREVLAASPDDAHATCMVGFAMLEDGDAEGIQYIERAMARHRDYTESGCKRIAKFLLDQGRGDEAEAYRERGESTAELIENAMQERYTITGRDSLAPHGLPPDKVEAVRASVSAFAGAQAIYLVRKPTRILPDRPFYLVGVAPALHWYDFRNEAAEARFQARLKREVTLPVEGMTVLLGQSRVSLRRRMAKVPGSRIAGA